jgi:regulator of protease activity HflC (stomatin/prohibitin superfamily)
VIYVLLLLIVIAAGIGMTVTVVNEFERAVVFRLGRVLGAKGPGPVLAVRGLDQVRRVSTQVVPLKVAATDVVTYDNSEARIDAVVYVRVTDPVKAVVEVDDYLNAVAQVFHAVLRAMAGELTLSDLLHQQAAVNDRLAETMAQRTAEWGLAISHAEITDVALRSGAAQPAPYRSEPAPYVPEPAPYVPEPATDEYL